jgi:hypothetical protein
MGREARVGISDWGACPGIILGRIRAGPLAESQ